MRGSNRFEKLLQFSACCKLCDWLNQIVRHSLVNNNEHPGFFFKPIKSFSRCSLRNYDDGCIVGGAVASWLVRSTLYRAVRVQALAGDIVLYSWSRPFTLTMPPSIQVYKWVLAINLRWTSIPSSGKYSQSLHATETGVGSSLMSHLGYMHTLPTCVPTFLHESKYGHSLVVRFLSHFIGSKRCYNEYSLSFSYLFR